MLPIHVQKKIIHYYCSTPCLGLVKVLGDLPRLDGVDRAHRDQQHVVRLNG